MLDINFTSAGVVIGAILFAANRAWRTWIERDKNKSFSVASLDGTKLIDLKGYSQIETTILVKKCLGPTIFSLPLEAASPKVARRNGLSSVPKVIKN